MPIINEYHSTNLGEAFVPEAAFAENRLMQTSAVPAVVNTGGNAVSGFSIRYTTIDELAAHDAMREPMDPAETFRRFGFIGE